MIYFFTGFPGFIARELIKELIKGDLPIKHIYLLILPNMKEKAVEELHSISTEVSFPIDKFSTITGDITKPNLGIPRELTSTLMESVHYVFHLAAVYDLAVDKETAELINVNGTKNVNDFVRQLDQLTRYVYFSTAYVSGERKGRIYEAELKMNQTFKNHYERTKYEAEVLVKQQSSQVPTTIIRPGIVRGHSETGETIKFDGPYFILHLLDRFRHSPFIPYIGKGEVEGNFVPVDYVIKASIYLSHFPSGAGKTYHLTDPAPFKMVEIYKMLAYEYLGKVPKGRIPLTLADASLRFPPLRKWLQVEREALPYFNCDSSYDCKVARKDLMQSQIHCPGFDKTLSTMVQFYRENKNDDDKYIKIQ
ncbi:SDR family oxidoreductase [Evansella tamaricis]|uniref:SDR family oxidoreductase n=1 Tax=Evansella tamaricis TaxID=2069301 RepID=UPI001FE3BC17|nr:SDR family oxidoreductase [Evansella tamaricis]